MLNKIKREDGITLSILVITIVIMLIISGVVIMGTVGDNGIMKRTENTTQKVNEYREHRGTEFNTLINGLN